MDANEIKMVIFDMDGLMLDTERCYYNGVKEMCEKKQIKVDMSIYRAVIGTSEAIDMEKFNKSTYPNDALEKMICQYVDNRRKELCEEGVAIKKGLRELLNILNKRNILRAVATSTPKPIAEKLLERVGIKKEFSVIVSATDVKKVKPAPDIFLLACEKVQILPERCLVLEDSVPGAKAAKAAGIPYIIVPDINYPEKEVAKAAEMVADSLLDVEKLFAL